MIKKVSTPQQESESQAKYRRTPDNVTAKWLPNGNLRFHTNDERKSQCAEMKCIDMHNVCDTILTTYPFNVIIWYDE
jgi:hypothetical protein